MFLRRTVQSRLSVFFVSVTLCGIVSAEQRRGGVPKAQPASDRIQRLIDEGKLNLPDGVAIERIPDDARDLGVVHNDAHRMSGVIAAVSGVEAIVHRNEVDSGFGFFMNYQPTSGASFPGAFLSDNLGLGNGFQPGDPVSSYDVKVFRSSRDPASNLLADVHLELWDGDPLALADTASGGFTNVPIPGSAVTFSGIPVNTVAILRAVLDPPVVVPSGVVWITMTGNSCRLGWRLSFTLPDVGFVGQDVLEVQRDFDGSTNGNGLCCDTGDPCDVSQGITCADDTDGSAQMCSDGDAEAAVLTFFGGSCTGRIDTDSCATFFNTMRAPAKITMSVLPVGNRSNATLDPGATISGNVISLSRGDTDVIFEVRVSNFDPDGLGVATNGYQAAFDGSSYTSGFAGTLNYAFGRHACVSDADCIPAYGGACTEFGTPCSTNDDCMPSETCVSQTRCSWNLCEPAFVVANRSDFLLRQAGTGVLVAVDTGTPRFRFGAVVTSGPPVVARSPYPSEGLYGGSFVLYVPPDAEGTFTISLKDPPATLVLDDTTFAGIPLLAIVPAKIKLLAGRCCIDEGPTSRCVDGLTAGECQDIPFSRAFVPDGKCSDADAQCDRPARNRYLSIAAGDPGVEQAIRVTRTNVPVSPGPCDGISLWVGQPFAVSENSQGVPGTPAFEDFMAASLQCDPLFVDWSSVGTVEVSHECIVPGQRYTVEVFNNTTPPTLASTWQPFELVTGRWGDLAGRFDPSTGIWAAPDGSVDVVVDVVAVIAGFTNAANAPRKARTDVEPATPDGVLNIIDIVVVIDAFASKPYPFVPTTAPCP